MCQVGETKETENNQPRQCWPKLIDLVIDFTVAWYLHSIVSAIYGTAPVMHDICRHRIVSASSESLSKSLTRSGLGAEEVELKLDLNFRDALKTMTAFATAFSAFSRFSFRIILRRNIIHIAAKPIATPAITRDPILPRRGWKEITPTTNTFSGTAKSVVIVSLWLSGRSSLRMIPMEGKYIPTHISKAKKAETIPRRLSAWMARTDHANATAETIRIPVMIIFTFTAFFCS
mmetsp:Transcript_27394/g.46612  ORF Transcript_27394/g.46612 Transcript_27394/m.46612 type:complete len:232 (+) Transcript_27394:130-825(+)